MTENNSGEIKILSDTLKNLQKSQKITKLGIPARGKIAKLGIHELRRRLDEIAFYPEHDKRKESPEYSKIHKKLVVEMDKPCLICRVRNSTLKDPSKNHYGARQMETHHHVIEWALANAISPEKFNSHLLPNLRKKHPDKSAYRKNFTKKQILDWVDHSEDNLWVLCDVHHRAKFFGIHQITDPIWGPMDLLDDSFEKYVKQQIQSNKKTKGIKKSN